MILRFIVACAIATAIASTTNAALKNRFRRPVAVAVSPDGARAFTANRDAGTVSIIDVERKRVLREIELGGRPSDMAMTGDGRRLLVTDENNHRLVSLSKTGGRWKVDSRIRVAPAPVGVVVNRDGSRAYVASLWSRRVTLVELKSNDENSKKGLSALKTIRLTFAPRRLCLAKNDSRLIVAGSFDGSLAVVDTKRLRLLATKEIPGHNIRGLSVSFDGRRLLTAQQTLNPLARSTFDDVHWGNMFSNVMYSFAIDDVCDPRADLHADRRATHLGRPGNAAGDPGAIAVAKGRMAVVLSGVNQVAVARDLEQPLNRVDLGKRPMAVAFSPDGSSVVVAETFSDAVSIVDASTATRTAVISLGPTPKPTRAQRGEELFFDARLSLEGWMSCHSCHTDGHTNDRLNDNLSDGSFGAPKRVLSLLGVSQTGPWAWTGRVERLEDQVRTSVNQTMQGARPNDNQTAALVAFMKTLEPPPPVAGFDETRNAESIARGRKLFEKLDCRGCHAPPTYTTRAAYDVGLNDGAGNAKFNPPSLRGVGWRGELFHDGRAKSLEEVFSKYRHQLPKAITESQRGDLIQFLRSL